MKAICLGIFLVLFGSNSYAGNMINPFWNSDGGGGGCATQSVLYSLTTATVTNSGTMYVTDGNTVSFKVTGNGKALYSVKLKTGTLAEGGYTTAKLYVNTANTFNGTNIAEQTITLIPAASTEFTTLFPGQPVLTNSVDYYIAIYPPVESYPDRFTVAYVDDVANDNAYLSTVGLAGPYNQDTNYGIYAEVMVCD